MPIYVYQCEACGHEAEEFQHMSDDPLTCCPVCGNSSFKRVPTLTSTPQQEFATPIEMHSIGMNHPDDIREFKRLCPDVDVSDDPSDPNYGVPIARTRHQKKKALETAGFEERN